MAEIEVLASWKKLKDKKERDFTRIKEKDLKKGQGSNTSTARLYYHNQAMEALKLLGKARAGFKYKAFGV